jgi:serine/threonine-protein kinase
MGVSFLSPLAALIALGAWWYISSNETKTVPSVTSLTLDRAVIRVQNAGLKTAIVNRSSSAPSGTVFDQQPIAGAELDEGDTVTLLVSKGPSTVAVPNAVGLSENEARDRMASAGLQVKVFEVFSDERDGTVVAQEPPAGEKVDKSETVRLNVSKGTGLVEVPSLVGRTGTEAEAELDNLGLEANVVEVPSVQPAGVVVAQHPTGGQVKKGSTVRLNISSGSP